MLRKPFEIAHGEALELLQKAKENSVDALVSDPPAGIDFMGKDWDCFRRKNNPNDTGRENVFGRTSEHAPHSYGESDRGQFVAYLTPIFREALRVIKPGGYGLIWALPRTSSWTAWALEDAGWEIRDCIYHHFATGFPKSLDISKELDRRAGAERKILGPSLTRRSQGANTAFPKRPHEQSVQESKRSVPQNHPMRTAPTTSDAKAWEGFGSALKPSTEVWWLVRKPTDLTYAENVLKWGVGALNIDASRIGRDPQDVPGWHKTGAKGSGGFQQTDTFKIRDMSPEEIQDRCGSKGRFPSHLLLSHHEECRLVGEGFVKSPNKVVQGGKSGGGYDVGSSNGTRHTEVPGYGDSDGREAVEVWECVGPRMIKQTVVILGALSLNLDEAGVVEFLQLLRLLVSALRDGSHSEGRRESPASGFAHARPGLESPDSQGDCQSCSRSGDVLLLQIEEAAQASALQLADALEYAHDQLHSQRYNPQSQFSAPRSSLDGAHESNTAWRRDENRTVASVSPSPSGVGGKESHTSDKESVDMPRGEPGCSSQNCSISGASDSSESISVRNGCMLTQSRRWVTAGLIASSRYLPINFDDQIISYPGCPVAELDRQSGTSRSGTGNPRVFKQKIRKGGLLNVVGECESEGTTYGDSGGSSRFFYIAKPARGEKEQGLLGHITCIRCGDLHSKTHIDPETGNTQPCIRNNHPTCKSTKLMSYLIRLICPPGGLVLDPFLGSGTTGVAAILEGFQFVGIEQDLRSYQIAKRRIEHALETKRKT